MFLAGLAGGLLLAHPVMGSVSGEMDEVVWGGRGLCLEYGSDEEPLWFGMYER